jgi:hypothetical protein
MSRKKALRNPGSHTLNLERLEGRVLLAGNVTTSLVGTTLTIDGDAQNNQVHITRVSPQKILLESGQSATTFNGKAAPVEIQFPDNGHLKINLKGGNDELSINQGWSVQPNGTFIVKSLTINMGTGQDGLTIYDTHVTGTTATTVSLGPDGNEGFNFLNIALGCQFAGALNVTATGGQSSVRIFEASVGTHLNITQGVGPDEAWVRNTPVGGNVTVTMGAGDDHCRLHNITAGNTITFYGQQNNDTLLGEDLDAKDLKLYLGAGNNTVELKRTGINPSILTNLLVNAGAGMDDIDIFFAQLGTATFQLGDGNNTLDGGGLTITTASVYGGAQKDDIAFTLSTFGTLIGYLYGGNDTFFTPAGFPVKATAKLFLLGGAGMNTLTDDGLIKPAGASATTIKNFAIA